MILVTVDCSSETTENRGNSIMFFKYLKGKKISYEFCIWEHYASGVKENEGILM